MEKIVEIVSVSILLTPFLSFMLYEFMQEGMIFSFWGKFIDGLPTWLNKPLGGCLKCFHVWVVIFVAWWLCIPIEKFIISLGCSYVILDKLFFK